MNAYFQHFRAWRVAFLAMVEHEQPTELECRGHEALDGGIWRYREQRATDKYYHPKKNEIPDDPDNAPDYKPRIGSPQRPADDDEQPEHPWGGSANGTEFAADDGSSTADPTDIAADT